MTKLLRTLLALAALIAIVAFAVANRTPVPVSFAPLPVLIELPVYGVFLLGLVLGGLVGGLALWLSGIPQRFHARRMRRKVSALENQVAVLQEREQRARAESYPAQRGIMAAGTSS
jgi:lipopolysaccharide assembly protein A